jgi:hypothetical protein
MSSSNNCFRDIFLLAFAGIVTNYSVLTELRNYTRGSAKQRVRLKVTGEGRESMKALIKRSVGKKRGCIWLILMFECLGKPY